jgi:hypothetical protein
LKKRGSTRGRERKKKELQKKKKKNKDSLFLAPKQYNDGDQGRNM